MFGRTKTYVKHISKLTSKDIPKVGEKAYFFRQIAELEPKVADGFVISSEALDDFLIANDIYEQIQESLDVIDFSSNESIRKAAGEIANKILAAEVPNFIRNRIIEEYNRLSKINSAVVSLEFSYIENDLQILSQGKSIVKGAEKLIELIKFKWKDIFSFEVLKKLPEFESIDTLFSAGLVVQKVVRSEISGTSYSVPPVTKEPNVVEVNAIFGERPVSDYIASDIYKISISNGEIISKTIVEQLYMYVQKGFDKYGIAKYEKIEISDLWRKKQTIQDEKILAMAREHLKIEQIFKIPLTLEWVVEAGKYYVTDVTFPKMESEIELEEGNKEETSSAKKSTSKTKNNEIIKNTTTNGVKYIKELQKEIEDIITKEEEKLIEDIKLNKQQKLELLKKSRNNQELTELPQKSRKSKTKIGYDIAPDLAHHLAKTDFYDFIFFDGTQLIEAHETIPEVIADSEHKVRSLVDNFAIDLQLMLESSGSERLFYQLSSVYRDTVKKINFNGEIDFAIDRFTKREKPLELELLSLRRLKVKLDNVSTSVIIPMPRVARDINIVSEKIREHAYFSTSSQKIYAEVVVPSFINHLDLVDSSFIDGLVVNYTDLIRFNLFKENVEDIDYHTVQPLLERISNIAHEKKLELIIRLERVPYLVLRELLVLRPHGFILSYIPDSDTLNLIRQLELL